MENMDSIWGFLGIIVIVCGFYAIYSLIKMKRVDDRPIAYPNGNILIG